VLPNESIRDGMVLADGGNIALTAQADFELLQLNGPAVPLTYACGPTAY
jgi:hypothetical protein